MKVGIVGLGRMGCAFAKRFSQAGYTVFGYDVGPEQAEVAWSQGVVLVENLAELAHEVPCIWLLIPPGKPVDMVLAQLLPELSQQHIIIDGGNSFFKDSIMRAQWVQQQGSLFLDCGTSGGLQGRELGFCLMLGGDYGAYQQIEPLLKAIAMPGGYMYCGPSGAGHYVKMVHNGIEYGLLQAYAEGFHVLKDGAYKDLNLEAIAQVWEHGSIIRSWLLTLTRQVLEKDSALKNVLGKVDEGGTGKWMVQEAQKQDVPVPVIEQALEVRRWSQKTGGNYATKLVAMLRNAFGGHVFLSKKEKQ